MTNEQIIRNAKQVLAEKGIIEYTGRVFTAKLPDGSIVEVPETEEIHTYNAWKDHGYQVQKGEKAIAQIMIWKYKAGKKNDEADQEETAKMFMKKAHFFSRRQVQPIQ